MKKRYEDVNFKTGYVSGYYDDKYEKDKIAIYKDIECGCMYIKLDDNKECICLDIFDKDKLNDFYNKCKHNLDKFGNLVAIREYIGEDCEITYSVCQEGINISKTIDDLDNNVTVDIGTFTFEDIKESINFYKFVCSCV